MPHDPTLPHHVAYIRERDDFHSKDQGEAERYVMAREAVLKYVLEEPTVKALLARWDNTTELSKLVKAIANASDGEQAAATQRMIQCVLALPRTIGRDARQVAASWGMPWVFVEDGLVRAFVLQHVGSAHGTPFRTWTELQKNELDIYLKIRSGATEQEVEAAFTRIRQARQINPLSGRAPMTKRKNAEKEAKKGEHLDRNVRWFVRRKIGGVPPTDLAREYFGDRFKDLENPASTVTKGIKQVQDLLKLTSFLRHPAPGRK